MYLPRYPLSGHPLPDASYDPRLPSPRKFTSKLVTIISLVVVAGVLVVIAVSFSANIIRSASQEAAPRATARTFCDDEVQQQYSAAYDLTSPSFQALESGDNFIQANELRDQQDGTMRSCDLAGLDYLQTGFDPYGVVFDAQVTLSTGAAHIGTIGVDQVTGQDHNTIWLIAYIDPSLDLGT